MLLLFTILFIFSLDILHILVHIIYTIIIITIVTLPICSCIGTTIIIITTFTISSSLCETRWNVKWWFIPTDRNTWTMCLTSVLLCRLIGRLHGGLGWWKLWQLRSITSRSSISLPSSSSIITCISSSTTSKSRFACYTISKHSPTRYRMTSKQLFLGE